MWILQYLWELSLPGFIMLLLFCGFLYTIFSKCLNVNFIAFEVIIDRLISKWEWLWLLSATHIFIFFIHFVFVTFIALLTDAAVFAVEFIHFLFSFIIVKCFESIYDFSIVIGVKRWRIVMFLFECSIVWEGASSFGFISCLIFQNQFFLFIWVEIEVLIISVRWVEISSATLFLFQS